MDPRRTERLSTSLREELSELIALEMADPRTDGVHVTEVLLSPDGRVASVRLFIPGEQERHKEVVATLEKAKAFLKSELKTRIDIFRMPELRFEADMTVSRSDRLNYLLKKVRKGRPRDTVHVEKAPEA